MRSRKLLHAATLDKTEDGGQARSSLQEDSSKPFTVCGLSFKSMRYTLPPEYSDVGWNLACNHVTCPDCLNHKSFKLAKASAIMEGHTHVYEK